MGIKDNPSLVETIIKQTAKPQEYQLLFNPATTSLLDKIKIICAKIYQTTNITFSSIAQEKIALFQQDNKYKN